ncbi:hypothetical protein LTR17_007359 [Elasticomyces elasticus]|nr:hypothetical protein LTR17_007359 [Elasticomyces elasticus]
MAETIPITLVAIVRIKDGKEERVSLRDAQKVAELFPERAPRQLSLDIAHPSQAKELWRILHEDVIANEVGRVAFRLHHQTDQPGTYIVIYE